VSLIVGAVGVANIMIISVLERRSEIGLRRALGATQGQIRTQFLGESILLTAIGFPGQRCQGLAFANRYRCSQSVITFVIDPWSSRAIAISCYATDGGLLVVSQSGPSRQHRSGSP